MTSVRERTESRQDRGVAAVARMNEAVAALERRKRFGPQQQTVRIGITPTRKCPSASPQVSRVTTTAVP
jgi:hypothetical protein